jgi:hypothetical protein
MDDEWRGDIGGGDGVGDCGGRGKSWSEPLLFSIVPQLEIENCGVINNLSTIARPLEFS